MGPVMNIRHGKGTEGTQVGWVLFETDRIMKGYSLGVDNVTREKIETDIPGYTNIFSGGAAAGGGRVWERFWIVPAGVSRFLSGEDDLALLDVPLMVRTEPMVMRSGKLASAPGLQPSPQAKAFAEWFSASYDRIAEEAVSKAPDGNGDVRTFQELRRVALLSAMAESLRDQGVAMPAWMKDYPVSSCTFGTTTPALTVQEKQGRAIRRVYGGVSLSPPDDLVTTKPAAPEASALAASLRQSLKADPLAPAMQLDSGGTTYTASALPGATTRDLGSLRLVATDLRVPVQAGTQIELTRSYDSFFAPADAWQSSWTLDLPVLERVKRPLKRTQNQATYTQAFQLSAPLGGQSAIFAKQEFVPALNGKLLVPTVAGEFLGMSSAADGRIGERTNVVWRRDGSSLHFSADTGRLAAVEQKPLTVIYRRDRRSGHILRIEGWYGKDLRADIRLAYDQQGRMVKAEGSNGDQVEYGYEPGGGLAQVSSRGSEVGYRYAGSLVTDLLHDGKLQRHFDYDARGRLTKETTESGAVVGYDTRYEAGGLTARAVPAAGGAAAPTVRYDDSFRPVQQIAADGTRRAWQYGRGKGYVLTVTGAGDGSYTETRSEDGLVRQVRGSDGRTVEGQFDSGGHLTGLRVGGEPLLAQEWLADGRLAQVTGVLAKAHPEYDGYGVLKRVVLTGIDQGTAAKRWMSTELNEAGLVSVVTDYSGAKTQIGYDETLQPRIIVSGRGDVELARDEQGRVRSAKTSWDEERDLSYDGEGHVSRARVRRGTETLGIELDRGLPARIVDFDGAETRLAYETGKRGPRLARARTEPGLELVYGYDQEDRLTSVTCGSSYRVRYSYDAGGRLTGLRREAMR
jgi:YD repeat-containing protein